ncbi:MAG: type II secretion system GspH family protein [Pseudomonadota bacterium]|nr:type II secretion system GspH family protein [Pseudomonadota bacterium]
MLKQGGFTLIEIAIAVVVIALLLGSLLGPLSVRIEQADRQETQALLDEIKEALYGFAVTHGRLPCPDTDGDGHEDRGGSPNYSCSTPFDFLPSADLGVARTDAWGRRFQYGVTPDFADEDPETVGPGGCVATSTTTTIALCSVGIGCIKDSAAAVECNVGNGIPAVVISYGANGGLAPTSADEIENQPPSDVNFVSTGYRQNPENQFDDLVAWISPHILKNRLVAAGRLP